MTDHRHTLETALADRDRARDIAVALDQENAALRTDWDRYRREANVMHSVVEQVGLLAEWWAGSVLGMPQSMAEDLRRILDGATFEEVRNA